MPLVSRLCATAGVALALTACSAAAGAAVRARLAPDIANTITFPAPPATRAEVPYSRVRPNADVTWGRADPRAVDAFRAARMFEGLRSHGDAANQVHAGHGYWLFAAGGDTLGAYANHTLYHKMREPGNAIHGEWGWLYAPTFFGPGADCIEAVTVIQDQAPQIWGWDWCGDSSHLARVIDVDRKFVMNYVRRMPDKLPKYTVETILGSDGVTWSMLLHNYRTHHWDVVYQTTGTRDPSYELGDEGWNMFETYTIVNSGVSNVCKPFPGPIVSEDISLTSDGKTFVPITFRDSASLQFNNFDCPQFLFSTPQADEWMMSYS